MDQHAYTYRKTYGKPKSKIKLVLGIITIICWTFNLYVFIADIGKTEKPFLSPLSSVKETFHPQPTSPTSRLKQTVENAMEGTHGTYAIAIYNFKTHESYLRNENKPFEAGSLYKLWIMATAYDRMHANKLDSTKVLSDDVTHLNMKFQIATDDADLTEGTVTMTVDQALEQMITISHNYAALLLSAELGLRSVSNVMENLGLDNSTLGTPPQTTAADVAHFLEKLYTGSIVDPDSSSGMLERLSRQQLNGGIAKYLPEDIEVANKTGEINDFKHDAGIVFTPQGDYIIVVLSESDDPAAAKERISLLSEQVFKYFQGNTI